MKTLDIFWSDYEVYGYCEYEKLLTGRNRNSDDHPNKEWQQRVKDEIANFK